MRDWKFISIVYRFHWRHVEKKMPNHEILINVLSVSYSLIMITSFVRRRNTVVKRISEKERRIMK